MEESRDSDQSFGTPQGFPTSLQFHYPPTLSGQVSHEDVVTSFDH